MNNFLARLGNGGHYEFQAETDTDAIVEVQKRFPEVNEGMTCYLYENTGQLREIMNFHKVHAAVTSVMAKAANEHERAGHLIEAIEDVNDFDEAFLGNHRNLQRNALL